MNHPWYPVLFHVTLPSKIYLENPKKRESSNSRKYLPPWQREIPTRETLDAGPKSSPFERWDRVPPFWKRGGELEKRLDTRSFMQSFPDPRRLEQNLDLSYASNRKLMSKTNTIRLWLVPSHLLRLREFTRKTSFEGSHSRDEGCGDNLPWIA